MSFFPKPAAPITEPQRRDLMEPVTASDTEDHRSEPSLVAPLDLPTSTTSKPTALCTDYQITFLPFHVPAHMSVAVANFFSWDSPAREKMNQQPEATRSIRPRASSWTRPRNIAFAFSRRSPPVATMSRWSTLEHSAQQGYGLRLKGRAIIRNPFRRVVPALAYDYDSEAEWKTPAMAKIWTQSSSPTLRARWTRLAMGNSTSRSHTEYSLELFEGETLTRLLSPTLTFAQDLESIDPFSTRHWTDSLDAPKRRTAHLSRSSASHFYRDRMALLIKQSKALFHSYRTRKARRKLCACWQGRPRGNLGALLTATI
ncbi:hypothetical protein MRB53_041366 [Persea americana]|nr:hypothetical protein MRB53_041366 [Persea americana]